MQQYASIAMLVFFAILFNQLANAQEEARFSGSLESNIQFFSEDTLIGAANTPQYDHQLFGADTWLQLKYSYKGFDVGLRVDFFNNSLLLNPMGSYNDQGIGRWYVSKKLEKLEISAGYLYDQIGSGMIFRAYEQRPLAIDQALYGARVKYELMPDWKIKAFTGRQKQQFDRYESVIRGASLEGYWSNEKEKALILAPGLGYVGRTIADDNMSRIVSTINTYSVVDSIVPDYNTHAVSLYNTLSFGPITWYVEGAYKTSEVFFDPLAKRTGRDGLITDGKLVKGSGSVLYTNIGFATKGLGITLEAKRTENFDYRADPLTSGIQGPTNFLPPLTRVNTYRLLARYGPATQPIGEKGLQLDISYKPSRKLSFNFNGSYLRSLDEDRGDLKGDTLLYWETYFEAQYKHSRKLLIKGGLQLQEYNQFVYLAKASENIETITPFIDVLYKIDRKKSIRAEFQYMRTEQDFGSWLFGLAEFSIAPHWSFSVSDMYNFDPNDSNPDQPRKDGKAAKVHYPRIDAFYTFKSNRFSLSYVKQVQGIVCAGGICRLEPAFSGVKVGIQSTF